MEERTIESSSNLVEIKQRNWEDLSIDCLVKIFKRVGLESLILDIPFVCKSWYKASLDPLCYKILHFEFLVLNRSEDSTLGKRCFPNTVPSMQFTKIAVHRSCGMATELKFPEYNSFFNDDLDKISIFLEYVLERCPELKTLILPVFKSKRLVKEINECLLKMFCKLKNLESIMILNTKCLFNEILNQIHIHCPNFQSLTAQIHHDHIYQWYLPRTGWDRIPNEIASAIVTSLPDITHLVLRDACLARESVLIILSGCRKLELLDVSNCRGFDADDAVILALASHIKIFKSEGSVVYEYSDDDEYGYAYWIDASDDEFHFLAGNNLIENNGPDLDSDSEDIGF